MLHHKSSYSKKFFGRGHRAEIILYKSAKDASEKYRGKNFRKVKELSDEFGRILAQRKENLYEEY